MCTLALPQVQSNTCPNLCRITWPFWNFTTGHVTRAAVVSAVTDNTSKEPNILGRERDLRCWQCNCSQRMLSGDLHLIITGVLEWRNQILYIWGLFSCALWNLLLSYSWISVTFSLIKLIRGKEPITAKIASFQNSFLIPKCLSKAVLQSQNFLLF